MASKKNVGNQAAGTEEAKASIAKQQAKKPAAKQKGSNGKAPKEKLSLIEKAKRYFSGVKSEIKRVVWPTKNELVKYSLAVVGMLIFFGVLIAIVDAVVVPLLYAFAGLR